MKKSKLFLTSVLILALMLGMLAGCGGTEASETASAVSEIASVAASEPAPAPEAPEVEEAPSAAEPASAVEEPVVEEPALEQVEYELPLFEETATVSLWYPLRQDNVQAPEKESGGQFFWAQMQEELNLDVEFVEPGQATASEKYNLMVASGDMTDLIVETFSRSGDGGAYLGGYDKAIEDGIYLELTDLVEESCPNYWYWINKTPDNKRNAYTDSGKLGAFLNINGEKMITNQGPAVNTEMLEASGLEIPTTMDEWSEMFAVLKGQGVAYPCAINTELAILEGGGANAMGASTATSFLIDRYDELVFGPTTPETREYIELLADYYSKGYIDPDFVSAATVMNNTNFNSGMTFVTRILQQEISQYYSVFGVNVTPVPFPKADEAPEMGMFLVETSTSLVSDAGVAVSTNCTDNLDTALLVMDWLYSPYGSTMANYGLLDVTYNINEDGEPMINDFYQERTNGIFNRGLYTCSGDIGLVWPNCSLTTAGEVEQAAMEGWTAKEWDGYLYSGLPAVALTAEESNEISSNWADIETLVDSTFLNWIVGAQELNDDTWNEFVDAIEEQGLEDCREAYTAAYERYLAK